MLNFPFFQFTTNIRNLNESIKIIYLIFKFSLLSINTYVMASWPISIYEVLVYHSKYSAPFL